MNRFSLLASGPPKASKKAFSPGTPSSVSTPGARKQRGSSIVPKAASTRMYGKAEPPAPSPGDGMFGGTEKSPYV